MSALAGADCATYHGGVYCPKCEVSELVPLELGNIALDHCETCAGIWFDFGELEAAIGLGSAAHLEALPDDDDKVARGPCPRCDVELQRLGASQQPGRLVPVDRCPSCMGLWLERSCLQPVENIRLLLSVRDLFLGDALDETLYEGLEDDHKDLLNQVIQLLRQHPRPVALLAYLERQAETADLPAKEES
jgi:Zn-finger nucleic acid-binding protein